MDQKALPVYDHITERSSGSWAILQIWQTSLCTNWVHLVLLLSTYCILHCANVKFLRITARPHWA